MIELAKRVEILKAFEQLNIALSKVKNIELLKDLQELMHKYFELVDNQG